MYQSSYDLLKSSVVKYQSLTIHLSGSGPNQILMQVY